jgi:1D-myo-inositol 3-kinase
MPEAEFGPPDLVAIGHVTRDLAADGPRIGGAAAYASAVAARLGLRAALVTCAGPEMDLSATLPGVAVEFVERDITTVLEHVYREGRRIQYLRARAAVIDRSAIHGEISNSRMLLLGPVVAEVDPGVVAAFPSALVAADAQGWLRRIGRDGLVEDGYLEDLNPRELSGRVTVLVLSEEDLVGQPIPQAWLSGFPIVILSRGRDGLRLHYNDRWWWMPAFPAEELDPTGAGDTVSVAFLVRYAETGDIGISARFAAAAASFIVEARGIEGAPSRAAVENRLNEHPEIRLVPEPGQ